MFSNPEKTINALAWSEGMTVADFGAGSGAMTFALAERLKGYNGKVYALEVQKNLLELVKSEAAHRNLSNIEIIWCDIEKLGGTKLRDHSIDLGVASNVLFQVEDKMGFVEEVRRTLKPNGKLLLIDWADTYGGMGPAKTAMITKENARALFEKKGFKFEKDVDAGSHHYGMLLIR